MPNPKVEVEISAKATGFEAQFQKISSAAVQAGSKIRSAFSGLQGAAATLGVGLSVGGFALFIKGAIDAADKLNDLQKATGVAATTLGGIGFAAQQAGTDLDGVAKGFGKLNLFIADALAGNEKAVETFKKLGISIADLRSNKADEIFARLADAFSSFEDDANKAAGANQIFGKSYASILPLLDEGGDSLRKNVAYFERYSAVTDDLVKASDQFNDSLTKLNLLNRAFANHLAAALLPSLQSLVDYLVRSKEGSNAFAEAAANVVEPLKTLAKFGVSAAGAFLALGDFIGGAAAALAALARGDLKAVGTILADIGDQQDKQVARVKELHRVIDATPTQLSASAGVGGRGGRRPPPNFGDAGAGAKDKVDEFARALERVSKLAAEADLELAAMFSTQEITGAQKALAALVSSDEWKKFTEPQRQDLTSRYAAIDAVQRETAEWKKKREEHEKEIKALQELEQQQQQAVQSFTQNLGQYADENAVIEKQIQLIGQDDVARQKLIETINYESLKKQALLADDQAGVAILDEQFRKRIALIEQLGAATKRFAEIQAYNNIFVDAFADSLTSLVNGTKSVKEAFKDMERTIVDALTRIAAQKLGEKIFGGAGGIGSIFEKLFSGAGGSGGGFDIGSWIAKLFSGLGFAEGGNPPIGKLSLVGERGPELIMPRSPVSVVPLGAGGGRAINVTINQTVTPGTSTQSARQAASQLRKAVMSSLRDP